MTKIYRAQGNGWRQIICLQELNKNSEYLKICKCNYTDNKLYAIKSERKIRNNETHTKNNVNIQKENEWQNEW